MVKLTKSDLEKEIAALNKKVDHLIDVNVDHGKQIHRLENLEDQLTNEIEAIKAEKRALQEDYHRVLHLLSKERIRTRRLLRDTVAVFTDPAEDGFNLLYDVMPEFDAKDLF